MPDFILSLELSRRFYQEALRPILAARFPGLPYAVARIGPGSEVLGLDTPMSTDHGWRRGMLCQGRSRIGGVRGAMGLRPWLIVAR